MALDFPANPTNNQEYQGYYWDATEEVWKLSATPPVINIDNLANVDTTGATDGQALVFDAANAQWVSGDVASGAEPAKTITSDNVVLDFSDGIGLEQRAVTGDVTFTASNYTSGVKKTIYLEGDTVQRSLTFPAAWNFITDKPTAIGASKKNILDLNSFGTSESTTVALWLGASSFEPIVASGGSESEMQINGINYKIHTFSSSGSLNVSSTGSIADINYLIVAGGGGGGRYGGAGAGGLLYGTYSLQQDIFPITVGSGGAGSNTTNGSYGSNSLALSLTAVGGAPGAENNATFSGGSGSGGGYNNGPGGPGTLGQGSNGGSGSNNGTDYSGGGGGGKNSAGSNATPAVGGNGGEGFQWINGAYYAGGGGGASFRNSATSGSGGLGGGGTGAKYGSATAISIAGSVGVNGTGGGGGAAYSGGSGVVIIAYPITDPN